MKQEITKFEDFDLTGYVPDLGNDIDADVVANGKCSNCGRKSPEYRDYRNEKYGSHRGFAVCPECGHSEEF